MENIREFWARSAQNSKIPGREAPENKVRPTLKKCDRNIALPARSGGTRWRSHALGSGGASAGRNRKGGKQAGSARSKRRGRGAEKPAGARDEAALDAAAAQWAALKRQSTQAQGRILAPGAALRLVVLAIVLAAWYFFAPAPEVVSRM